jgi:hypothetical protein
LRKMRVSPCTLRFESALPYLGHRRHHKTLHPPDHIWDVRYTLRAQPAIVAPSSRENFCSLPKRLSVFWSLYISNLSSDIVLLLPNSAAERLVLA